MSRSSLPNAEDIRAAHQLTGECRELGDDAHLWRRHLFAGIAALSGAGVVMGGEVAGVRAGRTAHTGLTDWGWENGFNRAGWERAKAEMTADPGLSRTPALAAYLARMLADDGASLSRADLIADAQWHHSWDYENLHRVIGINHTLWCWSAIPGTADEFHGMIVARAADERDFTPRQKAIIREVQAIVTPLVGCALARFAEPSPAALSIRVRQVLKCLLEGDGDKQAAVRLELSRFTVNEYTKQIYRHFGVQGRTELLARWIKRGWGPRCAWADGV